MQKTKVHELGIIDYNTCWAYQEQLAEQLINIKLRKRKQNIKDEASPIHHLIFCEHPHVYTLGKSGSQDNLLIDNDKLIQKDIQFFNTNRGGDITYHGPGQLVGYPIFDLDYFFTDVHKYLRSIEESVIRTLFEFDIEACRYPGFTGVWIEPENREKGRKICAIGVHMSRWVTMHGFALNINTDLSYFNYIVPCGIKDKKVTSMQHELGISVNKGDVKTKLIKNLSEIFNMEIINV